MSAKRRRAEEPENTSGLPEAVERRLGPLYREPPEEFVAGRDALARELRDEGDRDSAAAVKKLRRPSAAAWVINRISADEPERTAEFVRASEDLAEAQLRVLAGDADGTELRGAAATERERMDGLVADARKLALAGGGNVANVIDRVAETLRAVGSDDELRGRVLRGRVEKEQTAATVGIPGGLAPAPRKGAAGKRKVAGKPAGPSAGELQRARRELAKLRRELAAAEARRDRSEVAVADAEEGLRRARTALKDSKQAVRELKRQVESAERGAPS